MELKMKDIAQKAGVSVTAVSFALNGKEGISEKTREKILRIVEEEGYTSKKLIQKKEEASKLIFLLKRTVKILIHILSMRLCIK